MWPSFGQALQGNDVSDIVAKSQAASSESHALMDACMAVANLGEPGDRMRMISEQIVYASTMVKEALLIRYGYSGASTAAMNSAAGLFENAQKTLLEGGEGIQKIPPQLQELKDLNAEV